MRPSPEVPKLKAEATITEHKSIGSVWHTGDAIWWYEKKTDKFGGMLCVAEREVGPRGGVRVAARSVTIEGPTWESVQEAVQSLGFESPTLTDTEIRRTASL
jgi:hypothetical protein